MKRTPLVTRAPLQRKTPMPRGGARLARVPIKPVRRDRRSTGFDRRTAALIADRDGWRCQGCGASAADEPLDRQHRVARQMGGRHGQAAEVINSAANGVLLCRRLCHAACEARKIDMLQRGFWLPQGTDPTQVPILDWRMRGWLLLSDGTKRPVAVP